MSALTSYYLWVIAMTAALLYPVGQLIWTVSVRRMQRRLQKNLSPEELQGQKRRAYFVAIVVCLAFSMLFNFRLLDAG
ncbi:MAG: hypothetical protein OXI60_06300 [Acidiferrobacterales bacterium]|nr:hypothetical protein [Acidiferrobacterales bacterium]